MSGLYLWLFEETFIAKQNQQNNLFVKHRANRTLVQTSCPESCFHCVCPHLLRFFKKLAVNFVVFVNIDKTAYKHHYSGYK